MTDFKALLDSFEEIVREDVNEDSDSSNSCVRARYKHLLDFFSDERRITSEAAREGERLVARITALREYAVHATEALQKIASGFIGSKEMRELASAALSKNSNPSGRATAEPSLSHSGEDSGPVGLEPVCSYCSGTGIENVNWNDFSEPVKPCPKCGGKKSVLGVGNPLAKALALIEAKSHHWTAGQHFEHIQMLGKIARDALNSVTNPINLGIEKLTPEGNSQSHPFPKDCLQPDACDSACKCCQRWFYALSKSGNVEGGDK